RYRRQRGCRWGRRWRSWPCSHVALKGPSTLDTDSGFLDDPGVTRCFFVDELDERGLADGGGFDTGSIQQLANTFIAQDATDLLVQLVDDCGRRARRREQPVPEHDVDRYPAFGKSRPLSQCERRPLGARERDHLDLAGIDE